MMRDPIAWLVKQDPSMEYQVARDITGEPAEVCQMSRSRIAHSGWGKALLKAQREDGSWAADEPSGWADSAAGSATIALATLRALGVDPDDTLVRRAVELVRENVTHADESPYFRGTDEICINGIVLANAAYFGVDTDDTAALAASIVAARQRKDRGWNCDIDSKRSSFHSTICVLEGLLAYSRVHPGTAIDDTIARGIDYLLDRGLMRRKSTGEMIDPSFLRPAFPPGRRYDVVRGLDFLREAGLDADARIADVLDEVERLRGPKGRWAQGALLPGIDSDSERLHWLPMVGAFSPEVGDDSPVLTLMALRVLRWAGYDQGADSGAAPTSDEAPIDLLDEPPLETNPINEIPPTSEMPIVPRV